MRQYISGRGKSFLFAFRGIEHVIKTQPNARIHIIVITVVILLTFWLAIPFRDVAIIFLTIGMLIISNVFMTFAWYGHLKMKEYRWFDTLPLLVSFL